MRLPGHVIWEAGADIVDNNGRTLFNVGHMRKRQPRIRSGTPNIPDQVSPQSTSAREMVINRINMDMAMRSNWHFLPLFLFLMCSVASAVHAADWPQWRGVHRNGQTESARPFTSDVQIEEVWTGELGTGFSSIVVEGDRVISSGNRENQDTISCLNRKDGAVLWKYTYPSPLDPNLFEGGPTSTPTIARNRVYAISRTGDIFCLNLEDGSVYWKVKVPAPISENVPTWGFSGSPLVHNDRVYFNAGDHGLCLNADTGDVIWQSGAGELAGYSSPLLMPTAEGTILLLETEKSLVGVSPDSGEVLWRHPWITRYGINAADPLVLNQTQLILTSGYAKGATLLDLNDGPPKELWRNRNLRTQMSPGVLIDGYIYANDGDADRDCKFVCVEASSGTPKWQERGFGSSSVIAVGKQLFVLSESGELVIINAQPESMEIVARFPILSGKCWTPVTFANDMVFARNAVGKIVCFKLNQP